MRKRENAADDGFTLIETLVSTAVISVVMAAVSVFLVTTVSTTNSQGGLQIAAQVAATATAKVRAMKGSNLLTGRDVNSSHAQWMSPVPGVAGYLVDMVEAADSTATSNAGASAALPTTPEKTQINGIWYDQHYYIGTCLQPVAGGDCAKTAVGGVPFFRVVVAVTWPDRRCDGARCSYVTSTLVSSAPGEPVFNSGQTAKRPQITNPGDQAGTAGSPVNLQLLAAGGAQPLTWSFAGLPGGVTGTSGGLLTGSLPNTAGRHVVNVSVRDAFNLLGTAAFTWTVYAPPALLSSPRVEVWLDASDSARVITADGGPVTSGTKVRALKDRSGNGRDVTQPTAVNQMTVGTLNGHQAVMSGATTWFSSSATGNFRTVVAVAAPSLTAAANQTLFAAPANTDFSLRVWTGRIGSNAAGGQDSHDWAVGGASWTDSTPAVAPLPTDPAVYVAESAALVSNKSFSISSSFLNRGLIGALGEVIVFNTTLTTAERLQVEDYLAEKWSVRRTPGAPTGVVANPADTTATVSWTAPASSGNSPIAGYVVTATPADSSLPPVTCTADETPTNCVLSDLVNGAPYTVTVTALNGVGSGPASAGVELIAYPATFFTAGNLSAWLDASATGKVLAPGGAVATGGQKVQTWNDRSGNGRNATQATAANQMTVGSLNGRQALTSTATTWFNGTANGSFRTIISAVEIASAPYHTTFAAPANSDFSQRMLWGYLPTPATSSQLNVNDWSYGTGRSWTHSVPLYGVASTEGVFVSESASTVTNSFSVGTSFASRGLSGSFGELIAFNRVLTASERRQSEEYLARKWSLAVTPQAPAVTAVTRPAAGQLTVTWTAPDWNGGSAVTGYTVTAAPGKTCTAGATASSCTITGLTGGTTYPTTVTAANALGAGLASTAVDGTA